MSECIECYSYNTDLSRADDGHFRKECLDCGHIGGPYVTSSILEQEDESSSTEDQEVSQNEAESIFDY